MCFVSLLDILPFLSLPAPLTTTTTTTTMMMMMRTTLAAFTTAILATGVLAQDGAPIVYDTIHNITTLEGTWSSGSQHVLTGAVCGPKGLCDHSLSVFSPSGLCKPRGVHLYLSRHSRHLVLIVGTIHKIVHLILTSACSSADGYFEEALYRFSGNGNVLHLPTPANINIIINNK